MHLNIGKNLKDPINESYHYIYDNVNHTSDGYYIRHMLHLHHIYNRLDRCIFPNLNTECLHLPNINNQLLFHSYYPYYPTVSLKEIYWIFALRCGKLLGDLVNILSSLLLYFLFSFVQVSFSFLVLLVVFEVLTSSGGFLIF